MFAQFRALVVDLEAGMAGVGSVMPVLPRAPGIVVGVVGVVFSARHTVVERRISHL